MIRRVVVAALAVIALIAYPAAHLLARTQAQSAPHLSSPTWRLDPALASIVKADLGLPQSAVLHESDALSLHTLSYISDLAAPANGATAPTLTGNELDALFAAPAKVRSLAGLQLATNLRIVQLAGATRLRSLDGLQDHEHLESVAITGDVSFDGTGTQTPAPYASLAPLASDHDLKRVDLTATDVKTAAPLTGITDLDVVGLGQ